MQIQRIELWNFGKFEHEAWDFTSGLQVIYGENEAGKSTLLDFLRLLFYGNQRNVQDPRENPRKRYVTDGPAPEGLVILEEGGRLYRLTRKFGETNGKDKITLLDDMTGEKIPLARGVTPGEFFFDLDANAFQRSVFIGSAGTILPAVEGRGGDMLMDRLQNLESTGDESISADVVEKKLLTAQRALIHAKGSGGLLRDAQAREEALEAEKLQSLAKEEERREREQSLQDLQERWSALEQEEKAGEQEKLRWESIRQAEALQQLRQKDEKLAKLQKTKEQRREQLTTGTRTIDANLLTDASQAVGNWQNLQQMVEQLPAVEDELSAAPSPESLTALAEEEQALAQKEEAAGNLREQLLQKKSAWQRDQALHAEKESWMMQQREELDRERQELEEGENQKPSFFDWLLLLMALLSAASFVLYGLEKQIWFLVAAVVFLALCMARLLQKVHRRKQRAQRQLESRKLWEEKDGQWTQQWEALTEENPEDALRALEQELEQAEDLRVKHRMEEQQLESKRSALLQQQAVHREAKARQEEAMRKDQQMRERLRAAKEEALSYFEEDDAPTSPEKARMRLEEWRSNLRLAEEAEWQWQHVAQQEVPGAARWLALSEAEREAAWQTWGPELARLERDPQEALQEAEAELARMRRQREEVHIALLNEKHALQEAMRGVRNADTVGRELDALKARTGEMQVQYTALTLAREALEAAVRKAQQNFSPQLNARTSALFARLSDTKQRKLRVDASFGLSLEEPDSHQVADWKVLSTGTADQAYFALRLAVSELTARKEGLLLLLDDPFAYYDDHRAKEALRFLMEYASETGRQILLFTAHGRLVHWAEQEEIAVKWMEEGENV